MWRRHTCHGICGNGGQSVGVGYLFPLCGSQGLDSGLQAWRYVTLATEPSCWSRIISLFLIFFSMRKKIREENLLLWAIVLMSSHTEDLSPGLKLLPPYSTMPPHLNTICDVLKTWDFSLGMRNLPGLVVLAHESQICPSLCLIMSISANLRACAFSSAKWEYKWLLDKLKIGWDG